MEAPPDELLSDLSRGVDGGKAGVDTNELGKDEGTEEAGRVEFSNSSVGKDVGRRRVVCLRGALGVPSRSRLTASLSESLDTVSLARRIRCHAFAVREGGRDTLETPLAVGSTCKSSFWGN